MKYNTMLDCGFTIDHDGDVYDLPAHRLLYALQKRVDYLRANPEEILEAFGVYDTILNITTKD